MLCAINSNISAQTYSLPQLLELAQKKNPQISSDQLNILAEQSLRGASGIIPKTALKVQMGQNNSRLFDENISITQDIPNPGFIRAKKNLSDQRIRYSEIGMAMTRQELNYLVRQSWYKVIQLRELNDVLQQEDSLLAQFVKTANLKYKTGESNLLEKTSAENKRQALLQEINLNNVGISTEMN